MKTWICIAFIALSLGLNLSEYKPNILFYASLLVTNIYIATTSPSFTYMESMMLSYLIMFLKGFVLELLMHDRFILSDMHVLFQIVQVTILSLITCNPWVMSIIKRIITSNPNIKFTLFMTDKVGQALTLAGCYYHYLHDGLPMTQLVVVTGFCCMLTLIVLAMALTEHMNISEITSIVKSSLLEGLIIYYTAMMLVCIYYLYISQYIPNDIPMKTIISGIVVNTFVVIYTIQSKMHDKSHDKSHVKTD